MQSKATTPEDYLSELPEERKMAMTKLRNVIKDKLPKGFKEVMSYGMIGFVVPHESYPSGYHCNPKLPLPFINLGSQKNFIAVHHLGIYADKNLLDWFVAEYPKHVKTKLDMGKGCIRFKNMNDIPFEVIGELVSKMSMEAWISIYETNFKRKA